MVSGEDRAVKRQTTRITLQDSTGKRVLEQSRARLVLVSVIFAMSFLAVSGRMFDVAMTKNDIDESMPSGGNDSLRPRADVIDRNGEVLATSLKTQSLFANPRMIKNPLKVAHKLAKIIQDVPEKIIAIRLTSGRKFVWIKRQLTPRQQQEVNDLGVPGLEFEPEYKRIYPFGALFSHVLGYVNVDGKGQAGLEQSLNSRLKEEGADSLVLSLDMRVQGIVHEELKKAVDEFHALGGAGIVMDVKSGEMLALASLPDFDPNELKHDPKLTKYTNRATMGLYEMGSTFKTFTMAVALQSGVATMQSSYDATHPLYIGRFRISDAHPENRWLTLPEVFAYSSNIGTVKIIETVGKERQQAFLKGLGLLKPVQTELPEAVKPLIPNPWHDVNMMTVAYGHGIAVTPLHLVRAFASLVGNGNLLPVTLLKSGNDNKPKGALAANADTVSKIRYLLRLVVQHGTGEKAEATGYDVGGKTGTAEKIDENGHYMHDAKIVSFIGAFPIDNPRYVVLVTIDTPKGNKSTYGFATGGWVSAPAVSQIISRMAPLYGMRPHYETPEEKAKSDKEWGEGKANNASPKTNQAA